MIGNKSHKKSVWGFSELDFGRVWRDLGRLLGTLGHSWAPLGRFLGVSWALLGASWVPVGCHMLPWMAPDSILEGSGAGPGRVLKGPGPLFLLFCCFLRATANLLNI